MSKQFLNRKNCYVASGDASVRMLSPEYLVSGVKYQESVRVWENGSYNPRQIGALIGYVGPPPNFCYMFFLAKI